MNKIFKSLLLIAPLAGVLLYIGMIGGDVHATDEEATTTENVQGFVPDGETSRFPKALHYLLPPPVPSLFPGLSDPNRSFNTLECEDGKDNDGDGLIDEEDRDEMLCNPTEHVAYGAVDPNEELKQPIHYSHKLHAGELQIECEYCHTYARRSIHAGIPPVQVCMNCHGDNAGGGNKIQIEGRSQQAVDDLNYLREQYAKGEEIGWIKVHDLPDFVYFAHKGHVKAGVKCQECHGEIQADHTVARRVGELTMGWCLNCHESHPSIEDNYCDASELSEENPTCSSAELRRTEIKDCWNCHK